MNRLLNGLGDLERLAEIESHYQQLYQHLVYLQGKWKWPFIPWIKNLDQCVQLFDKDELSQATIQHLQQKVKSNPLLELHEADSRIVVENLQIQLTGEASPVTTPTFPPTEMSPISISAPMTKKRTIKSQADYDNLLEIQKVNISAMTKLSSDNFQYQHAVHELKNTIQVLLKEQSTLRSDLEKERKLNVLLGG